MGQSTQLQALSLDSPQLTEKLDQILDMIGDYYAFDGHHFDRSRVLDAVTKLVEHPDWGRIWFITSDKDGSENLVGYAILTFSFSLEFHGRDSFLDEIFIQEAFRGQGHGTRALGLITGWARSSGVQAIHLEVDASNEQAQSVYENEGFKKRDRFFLMSKYLTE